MKGINKKIVTLLTTGVITVGGSAVVYANDTSIDDSGKRAVIAQTYESVDGQAVTKVVSTLGEPDGNTAVKGFKIKLELDDLVADGTLDQETVDKLTEYLEQKAEQHMAEFEKSLPALEEGKTQVFIKGDRAAMPANPFEEAVTDGIITQEQADAIMKNARTNARFGFGGAMVAVRMAGFDKLVEDGVIDQTTADKLTDYMKQQSEQRMAEFEKAQSSAEGEDRVFINRVEGGAAANPFENAVADGIITQEQADAIMAAMPAKMEFGFHSKRIGMGMCSESLVADGVIDQATFDKMTAFLEEKKEEMLEARKAEMDKVKSMTEEERQAYFESNKGNVKYDLYTEMVEAGVITQDQADAVKDAMPECVAPTAE